MILLDTHIWVWWVQGDPKLTSAQHRHLTANQPTGLGVSVVSCWEVAQLIAGGKVSFPVPVEDWVRAALALPGVRSVALTTDIAVASTKLPAPFHRDPADRFLVATARSHGIPMLTADARILAYPHVTCLT